MTATIPRATGKRASAADIAQRTAVLFIERRTLGLTRRVRQSEVIDAEAHKLDLAWLGVSKHLLHRKVLREVNRLDGDMREYLESRSSPCSMLAKGMWLFSLALVKEVSDKVAVWQTERAALGRKLAREGLAAAKQEAERALGDQYREEEYPSAEEVEAAFIVKARWITYNVPAALEQVSEELYQREMARVQQEWGKAGDDILAALGENLATMVERMAERLGEDEDGKPKVFRDSTVQQMVEFLDLFAARAVGGGGNLTALVEQARRLLKGVSPEDLREKGLARDRVRAGFENITAKLAKLDVVPAKQRRVILDEAGA
jgi:hypothetical protein